MKLRRVTLRTPAVPMVDVLGVSVPETEYAQMTSELQSIAEIDAQIAELAARRVSAEKALFDAIERTGAPKIQQAGLVAEVVTPSGRSSSYIDPKAFRKLVKDDVAFYECVTVGVTAAKGVLSGKQLAEITQVTPGTPGAPTLKITKAKK